MVIEGNMLVVVLVEGNSYEVLSGACPCYK